MRQHTDSLASDLTALLRMVNRAASHEMLQSLSRFDLSLTQLKALHMLDRANGVPLNQLAAKLTLSPGAASRALQDLHRAGLVRRREDDSDRRVRRFALTAKGERLLERMMAARRSAVLELTAHLDESERARLAEAIAPLLARDREAAR
jgi:DNA-binding MarR family transcriptional regulator